MTHERFVDDQDVTSLPPHRSHLVSTDVPNMFEIYNIDFAAVTEARIQPQPFS